MKVEFDWYIPEAQVAVWVVADVGRRTDDVFVEEIRLDGHDGFVLDGAVMQEKQPASFRALCERARKEADERWAEEAA